MKKDKSRVVTPFAIERTFSVVRDVPPRELPSGCGGAFASRASMLLALLPDLLPGFERGGPVLVPNDAAGLDPAGLAVRLRSFIPGRVDGRWADAVLQVIEEAGRSASRGMAAPAVFEALGRLQAAAMAGGDRSPAIPVSALREAALREDWTRLAHLATRWAEWQLSGLGEGDSGGEVHPAGAPPDLPGGAAGVLDDPWVGEALQRLDRGRIEDFRRVWAEGAGDHCMRRLFPLIRILRARAGDRLSADHLAGLVRTIRLHLATAEPLPVRARRAAGRRAIPTKLAIDALVMEQTLALLPAVPEWVRERPWVLTIPWLRGLHGEGWPDRLLSHLAFLEVPDPVGGRTIRERLAAGEAGVPLAVRLLHHIRLTAKALARTLRFRMPGATERAVGARSFGPGSASLIHPTSRVAAHACALGLCDLLAAEERAHRGRLQTGWAAPLARRILAHEFDEASVLAGRFLDEEGLAAALRLEDPDSATSWAGAKRRCATDGLLALEARWGPRLARALPGGALGDLAARFGQAMAGLGFDRGREVSKALVGLLAAAVRDGSAGRIPSPLRHLFEREPSRTQARRVSSLAIHAIRKELVRWHVADVYLHAAVILDAQGGWDRQSRRGLLRAVRPALGERDPFRDVVEYARGFAAAGVALELAKVAALMEFPWETVPGLPVPPIPGPPLTMDAVLLRRARESIRGSKQRPATLEDWLSMEGFDPAPLRAPPPKGPDGAPHVRRDADAHAAGCLSARFPLQIVIGVARRLYGLYRELR